MAEPFIIKQNDTRPRFVVSLLQDVGGVNEGAIDLTDATAVTFLMRLATESDPAAPKVEAAAVITDAVTGEVTYTWATGDTDTVGEYNVEVEIEWTDGGIETVPNADYWTVEVIDDLGGT